MRGFLCAAAILLAGCNAGGLGQDQVCHCAAVEGCVVARVTRAASGAFPWTFKISPNPSDGVGTLVAVAFTNASVPTVIARGTQRDADFRQAGARLDVPVGCVGASPRAVEVNAILDENEPLGADEVGSNDTFDTCARPRPGLAGVEPGQVVIVEMSLAESCNP